jgi:hypothetical protein
MGRFCAGAPVLRVGAPQGCMWGRFLLSETGSARRDEPRRRLEGNYRPRLQEPLPVGERLATEWPVKGLLNGLPCGSRIWIIRGAPAVDASSSGLDIANGRDTVVDDSAIRMPNPA